MRLRGILVASAALGLLAGGAGCAAEEAHGGEVKCSGINSCAGKGACGASTGKHDCAGKNSCKGKGWIHVDSAQACTDQGGTVLDG